VLNLIFDTHIFLGLILATFTFILLGARYLSKELITDQDIVISVLINCYCVILIFHGWRLDPILLYSQFLICIVIAWLMSQNLSLRGKELLNEVFSEDIF